MTLMASNGMNPMGMVLDSKIIMIYLLAFPVLIKGRVDGFVNLLREVFPSCMSDMDRRI